MKKSKGLVQQIKDENKVKGFEIKWLQKQKEMLLHRREELKGEIQIRDTEIRLLEQILFRMMEKIGSDMEIDMDKLQEAGTVYCMTDGHHTIKYTLTPPDSGKTETKEKV